jgi:hypothetical protein
MTTSETQDRVQAIGREWTPWTIVHRGTLEPVLPMDCADSGLGEDEAVLVFRSAVAAARGCEHQKNWGVDCVPVLLSAVISHEAAGNAPPEDPMNQHIREKMYEAQGITKVAGKIGPERKAGQ